MKAMLIVLGSFFSAHGQITEQRIPQVLASLECKESKRATGYDWFIESIKKGEGGDGIHYSWMDKMRQLGIKQAFFVVQFSYKNGEYRYKVKGISYLRQYYCYEGEVKGGKLLREIRKSGLEQELKDAIVARIRKFEKPYQSGNVKEGEEYHYLLDDEYLPIIDFVT